MYWILFAILIHCGLSLPVNSNPDNSNPGFRFQVTQKGINYLRDVLIPVVTDAIKTAEIPPINQRVDTPIGHITFGLSSIRIGNVDISHTTVELDTPSNAVAAISDAFIALNARWNYREDSWPHISDDGSVDISATQISINLNLQIGTTDKGEPHVTTKTCSFNIGHVDVTFHGGASWLYNLFSSSIADALKDAIKDQVCPLVTDAVDTNLNDILDTVDLKADIDDNCYIDYSLVQPPFVIKDAIFVNGKGEIFDKSNPKECPSPKQDMPETVDSERMVTLWITEYMLNTAGYAYQTAGFLQYNLTSDDIPDKIPIKMTTGFFKYFVPILYKTYPDKDLTLWLYVTKPVTFDVNKAGVSGRAEGTITWLVHVNDTLVPAFTLDAQLDLCVNLSVQLGSNSEIYLDLITVEPYIQLKSSNIGNFSVSALQSFIKFSRALIVPFVNALVKNGIPLPSFDYVSFTGFDFNLEDGYIQIHTDIKYVPNERVSSEREYYSLSKDGFECKMKDKDLWANTVADDIFSYFSNEVN
ncbi:bactericidal permeability-increasing protein-like [Bolinopsis microptera]|uniref:bactericidal permeability-increasing protein-like n=1 Tax=Bolinopsis microptera TaxID=2820187 RepID=UPI00307AA557